jgi:hypothetical protein
MGLSELPRRRPEWDLLKQLLTHEAANGKYTVAEQSQYKLEKYRAKRPPARRQTRHPEFM